jgi:hypothetical protein
MRSLVKKWAVKVKLAQVDRADVLVAVGAESRRLRRKVSAAELFREFGMERIRVIAAAARQAAA